MARKKRKLEHLQTAELERLISVWQSVQKRHKPDSVEWKYASAALAPLFEEMAARQREHRRNPTTPKRRTAHAKRKRAAGRPARSPAGRGRSRPRHRYRAKIRVPGRRGHGYGDQLMTKEFSAISDKAALSYCKGLLIHKLPKGAEAVSCKRIAARPAKKKNPIETSPELARAVRAFERFTGHSPDFVETYLEPDGGGAAWALGPVTQIGYIATRDGETAEYIHKFHQTCRPLLAASSDGNALLLLGGAYSVTNRGIVDDA